MSNKNKYLTESNSFHLSIYLIIAYFIVLLYADIINCTLWYDEAYTVAMMQYSFTDILGITANDVHPPLYYFMLKAFCSIFGDSQYIMRIFSNFGVMACLVLGVFPIRRLFGDNITLIYTLIMVLMPANQFLGVEIRMYSWTMFFVLACSVYAYEAYLDSKLINFSKMTVYATSAAYTHYYGLVAIASIFFLLWIFSLKKQEKIIRLILFTSIFLLVYSPWIPVFITQFDKVSHNYWIEIPTPKDLLLFCYYFFSPKEPAHPYMIFSLPVMSVALSAMLLCISVCIFYIIKIHCIKLTDRLLCADGFISVYVLTLFITFVITFGGIPISVPRYTCCVLGPLILGISIYIPEIYKINKTISGIFLIILFILGSARFFSEKAYYSMKKNETEQINTILNNKENKSNVIIAGFMSYPELAKISLAHPDKTCILVSVEDKSEYAPFRLNVTDSIPDITEYFVIRASNDTLSIPANYKINDKLELKDLSIIYINKQNIPK